MSLTILAVIGGAFNRYMLRNIRKELSDFQLQLFTALDQRYISVSAHTLHQTSDQREHDLMRREIERLETLITSHMEHC